MCDVKATITNSMRGGYVIKIHVPYPDRSAGKTLVESLRKLGIEVKDPYCKLS